MVKYAMLRVDIVCLVIVLVYINVCCIKLLAQRICRLIQCEHLRSSVFNAISGKVQVKVWSENSPLPFVVLLTKQSHCLPLVVYRTKEIDGKCQNKL